MSTVQASLRSPVVSGPRAVGRRQSVLRNAFAPARAAASLQLGARTRLAPLDGCRVPCPSRGAPARPGAGRRPSTTVAAAAAPLAAIKSLVSPTDTWAIWSLLLATSALGIWAEKTKWGAALSGPLVSTLAALALSNVGVLPTSAPAYGVVTGYLLPLAVPLLLFSADLQRVVRDTGRLLGAFVIGATGTVLGTLIGLALFPMTHLGEDAWKMAAAYCSRHIGGAVNYVAVSEYLNITPSIVAGGLAADNLVCALYFAGIFALAGPAASAVAAATGSGGGGGRAAAAAAEPAASAGASTSGGGGVPESSDSDAAAVAAAGGAGAGGEYSAEEKRRGAISVTFGAYALAVAGAICAGSVAAARAMGVAGADIPIITLVATVFPKQVGALAPAGEGLACILLQVFFSVVGAAGSIREMLATAPALFLFSLIQVAVHLGFVLALGPRFGFTRPEILLASNANVGGPTTAAGMATAKGWKNLMVPAILLGILGYAVATFASIALGQAVLAPLWRLYSPVVV